MYSLPHEPRFGRRVRVTMLQAATKLLGVDVSVASHDAYICWMSFIVRVLKWGHHHVRNKAVCLES